MKQKKSELTLQTELNKVQQLASEQIKHAEKKMNSLIQKALTIYKDELDPNLAQFYYEYGNILLQLLEEKDTENYIEEKENPKAQLITIKDDNQAQNDKELQDAQVAWENLEISRSIIQRQINMLSVEYDELQEKMIKIREQKTQWQASLSKSLKRIGDLQSWYIVYLYRREDYQEALDSYELLLKSLPQNNINEIAELHYKIGNVQLQQALPGCENKALKNLQTSFQLCEKIQKLDLGYYDLNSAQSIQVIRDKLSNLTNSEQITLLILLLEKIEDTLSQLKETNECKQEIDKWRQNNFQLNGEGEDSRKSNKKAIHEFAQQQRLPSEKFHQIQDRPNKKIINLGVFGSAAKQPKQDLATFDDVLKKLKY